MNATTKRLLIGAAAGYAAGYMLRGRIPALGIGLGSPMVAALAGAGIAYATR